MKTEKQHFDTGRPLRVLFVNRMAGMIRGGGETFDLEIARQLEKLGVQTSFLTGLPLFGSARTPLDRPRSYAIRTPYTGWFPWDRVRGGWRLRMLDFVIFEHMAASWAAARKDQFDVVQVCELPFFVNAWKRKRTGVPVVMRLTAPNYYDPVDAVHQADALIASGTTIQKLRSQLPHCINIPNAVDAEYFKPCFSRFRELNNYGNNDFLILYVARMVPFKRHEFLLEAFKDVLAHVPQAKLILAGTGPLESALRKKVVESGIQAAVKFLGQVSYSELPGIYSAADAAVVASDEGESFCFSALEAMAMELPIVATACGMLPELVDEGKGGYIVSIGDREAFSARLLLLARDRAAGKSLGEYNRQKVNRIHTWGGGAEKLISIYHDVKCSLL
ncbi:MAG: glycosyltransferase family 4 protein [Kiritimatiellia bacterium]